MRHALKMLLSPWLLLLIGVWVALQVIPVGFFPLSTEEKRGVYLSERTAALSGIELVSLLGQAEGSAKACGRDFDAGMADAALSHARLTMAQVREDSVLNDYWRTGLSRGAVENCASAVSRFGPDGTAFSDLVR